MTYNDRKIKSSQKAHSRQVKTRPAFVSDYTMNMDKKIIELRDILDRNEVNTPEIEKMIVDAQDQIRMVGISGDGRDAEEHSRIATRILEGIRSKAGISTNSHAGDIIDQIQWMLEQSTKGSE